MELVLNQNSGGRRRRVRRGRRVVVQAAPTVKQSKRARQRQNRRKLFRELQEKCGTPDLKGPMAASSMVEPGLPVTGGLTPDGLSWAMKALNPNGEESTKVNGIPDHTSVPVVTPEFRSDVVVSGVTGTGNDDMDIIVLPFGDLVAIYRRYKAATPPASLTTGWIPVWNPNFTVTQVNIPADGIVSGAGLTYQVPVFQSSMPQYYGYGRQTYKGLTAILDASTMLDQGRVTAGQLALPFYNEGSSVFSPTFSATTAAYNIVALENYSLNGIPLDESCLVQACPSCAVWEAREGVYLPIRFRDPVHLFSGSGTTGVLSINTPSGTTSCINTPTVATNPSGVTGAVDVALGPCMPLNGLTGVVLFRGIDATANIRLKLHSGMEAQVDTCGVISPYQRMSPVLDCEALTTVARESQVLPMAFVSAANSLGLLGGLLQKIIPGMRGIRNKLADSGLPGISQFMKFQNKYIYDPLGLGTTPSSSPMSNPLSDPMRRLWDRMSNRRLGLHRNAYAGYNMYA